MTRTRDLQAVILDGNDLQGMQVQMRIITVSQEADDVKAVLCALILITCAQVSAQGTAAKWFTTAVGINGYTNNEVRDTPRNAPHIWRWQTVETITGTLTIPENLVILRRVDVEGDSPGG
jgi:hypothetical protein